MDNTLDSRIPTTRDAFLGGELEILQAKNGPRAGTDSVLLAASIPATKGQSVLEAGIGSGVVSFCLNKRIGPIEITGIELQKDLAEIARENARNNGLNKHFSLLEGDVTGSGNSWKAMGLKPDSYDHAFANPPFYDNSQSRTPKDPVKAQAHMHNTDSLERWVRFLVAHTRPKGTITIVHTAEMLGKLLAFFERRVGNIRIIPIYSKKHQPASRVLVQGTKSSKGPLHIEQGIIMHDETGAFTDKAVSILKHGAGLFE